MSFVLNLANALHKARHATGGADAIAPADIGAEVAGAAAAEAVIARAAEGLLAPKASPTFTGTVAGVTKAHVGLGSVDNTADSAKPVSTAQQTALNLKLDTTVGNSTYAPTAGSPNYAAQPVMSVNLLANSHPSVDAGWTLMPGSDGAFTRYFNPAGAPDGGACVSLTWTAGATSLARLRLLRTNNGIVVAGQTYTLSAWVRYSVAKTVKVGCDWYNTGGAYVDYMESSTAIPAGVWTRISVTGVAPSGAVSADCKVTPEGGATNTGDVLSVCMGMLDRSSVLHDYPDALTAIYAYARSTGAVVYAPAPTGVAGTDWANLTQAIAATPTGGVLKLQNGGLTRYKIDRALVVDNAMGIHGEGVFPLYGSINDQGFKSIDFPLLAPYLAGTVIEQQTAGLSVIQVPVRGVPVDLRDFGVTWATAIAFQNTGHGIDASAPASISGGTYGNSDNGMMGGRWKNLYCFGHDGNHYAWVMSNLLYGTFDDLHSTGGGALKFDTDAEYGRYYGGSVFNHLYGQIIAGGTAHGLYLAGSSSYTNGILFNRPQLTVQDPGSGPSTQLGIPTPPTSAQKTVKMDASVTKYFTFVQQDWETNVGSTWDAVTSANINVDPAGITF